jgi:hypothetical protein
MAIADEAHAYEAERGMVAVLEWRAWEGFLLAHVLGDHAVRIETDPFREFPKAEFERICANVATVCFQINLSVRRQLPIGVRDLAIRFRERGLYVVNGSVEDIRKSALHAHLEAVGLRSPKADPIGAPDERLFIKTDLNYGGDVERWLPPEIIMAAGLDRLISADLGAYNYRIAERSELPDAVWTDPAIVVERYVGNAEESFFRVYFAGKRIVIVKAFAPGIIKKMSNDPRDVNFLAELDSLKAGDDRLPLSPALKQDVATFVATAPVEFGCIDIVHDGEDRHYVIDLNLTPYAGRGSSDPALTRFLRQGLMNARQRKPPAPSDLRSPLIGRDREIANLQSAPDRRQTVTCAWDATSKR